MSVSLCSFYRKIVIKFGKKKRKKAESSEELSDDDRPPRRSSKDDDSVSFDFCVQCPCEKSQLCKELVVSGYC